MKYQNYLVVIIYSFLYIELIKLLILYNIINSTNPKRLRYNIIWF